MVDPPFTTSLEPNPTTGKYKVKGSFPDLLNTLAGTKNFTYTIEPPPDGKWGGLQPDGTWNGMIDQVINGKADFGKKTNKT